MEFPQHSAIVNFIWNIADDVLRAVHALEEEREGFLEPILLRTEATP
jgi:hypothetical protein